MNLKVITFIYFSLVTSFVKGEYSHPINLGKEIFKYVNNGYSKGFIDLLVTYDDFSKTFAQNNKDYNKNTVDNVLLKSKRGYDVSRKQLLNDFQKVQSQLNNLSCSPFLEKIYYRDVKNEIPLKTGVLDFLFSCSEKDYMLHINVVETLNGWKILEKLTLEPKQTTTTKTVYTSLEEAFTSPKNVIKLELFSKNLKQLPPEIGELINVEDIILRNNDIIELPVEFSNLKKLESLSLGNNQNINLEQVFTILKKLPNLKSLDLEMNNISKIPSNIKDLHHLQEIYISGNPLSEKEKKKLSEALPNLTIY